MSLYCIDLILKTIKEKSKSRSIGVGDGNVFDYSDGKKCEQKCCQNSDYVSKTIKKEERSKYQNDSDDSWKE